MKDFLPISVKYFSLLLSIRYCHQRSNTKVTMSLCLWSYLLLLDDFARANPSMDHIRALRARVAHLPRDWNCRLGQLHETWLRTVESDLAPLNIGMATAYRWMQNRQPWSTFVGTAISSTGQAGRWWWWLDAEKRGPVSHSVVWYWKGVQTCRNLVTSIPCDQAAES